MSPTECDAIELPVEIDSKNVRGGEVHGGTVIPQRYAAWLPALLFCPPQAGLGGPAWELWPGGIFLERALNELQPFTDSISAIEHPLPSGRPK
jgi:hypothetical protein